MKGGGGIGCRGRVHVTVHSSLGSRIHFFIIIRLRNDEGGGEAGCRGEVHVNFGSKTQVFYSGASSNENGGWAAGWKSPF